MYVPFGDANVVEGAVCVCVCVCLKGRWAQTGRRSRWRWVKGGGGGVRTCLGIVAVEIVVGGSG